MAYLGNAPARSFISFERQVFTIVNSQTAYTLDHSVNNENDIRLVINNIVQEPGSGKAYTASGTTLTLSAALTNGTDEMYCVFLGRAVATNKPGAGSVGTTELAADAVTEAKIADDAVESEHLNNNVISGQTELAAEPADTDEFLVSDAGTLKRIDYSYIKGGGITEVDMWRVNTTTSISSGSMDITANWERCDTNFEKIGTGLTESSGVFTFPSTGKYLTCYDITFKTTATTAYAGIYLYLSTDGGSNFSHIVANTNTQIYSAGALSLGNASGCGVIDVTDASQFKWKLNIDYQNPSSGSPAIYAHTDRNRSYIYIIRLGDT
jgi:hypothetical protein